MTARTQSWLNAAMVLMLGTILALVLFLALHPLRMDSPASSGGRALLRLDSALGATVEPIDAKLAREEGLASSAGYVVVTSVATKGPAASVGLRVGDVIERIGGKPAEEMSDHTYAAVPVSIWRAGKQSIVNIKLGSVGRG